MAAVSNAPGLANAGRLLLCSITSIAKVIRGGRSHDNELVDLAEHSQDPQKTENHKGGESFVLVLPFEALHLWDVRICFDLVQ